MAKLPYIQFYVGDYIKSTRVLNLEEKGAWTEILWHIWEHGQEGIFTGSWEDICLIIGCPDIQKCSQIFGKISAKKVCDLEVVTKSDILAQEVVTIVNRRMNREFKLSKKRSQIATDAAEERSKNSSKTSAKHQQNPDIEYDYDNDIEVKDDSGKILKPSLQNFLIYAESVFEGNFEQVKKGVSLKYKSWCVNGWKDGNNSEIKNWKSKILNTLPHIKLEELTNGKSTENIKRESITNLSRLATSILEGSKTKENN